MVNCPGFSPQYQRQGAYEHALLECIGFSVCLGTRDFIESLKEMTGCCGCAGNRD